MYKFLKIQVKNHFQTANRVPAQTIQHNSKPLPSRIWTNSIPLIQNLSIYRSIKIVSFSTNWTFQQSPPTFNLLPLDVWLVLA